MLCALAWLVPTWVSRCSCCQGKPGIWRKQWYQIRASIVLSWHPGSSVRSSFYCLTRPSYQRPIEVRFASNLQSFPDLERNLSAEQDKTTFFACSGSCLGRPLGHRMLLRMFIQGQLVLSIYSPSQGGSGRAVAVHLTLSLSFAFSLCRKETVAIERLL